MGWSEGKFDYDVVIIGAGISGVCFAHRLQEQHPHLSYCILESRSEVGGTWSFFQYPGLRSDSDLFTFGFPWKPWTSPNPIAKGSAIVEYMKSAIAEDGIDKHIKLDHKVNQLSWCSTSRAWTVDVTVHHEARKTLRTRFVMLGTGYYDYDQPLEAYIPGINNFSGRVVHPQFWPKDLDYKDKDVVIIGSGATAITLLPAMADDVKHITMLQRSPSYILSVQMGNPLEQQIRALFPAAMASTLLRLKWIILPTIFRRGCLRFPNAARRFMRNVTLAELSGEEMLDSHFKPTYNPFEQRMCMCPDGDFYKCLRDGKGSIKTGSIQTVTSDSIKLESGDVLHPDIIVTATGLKLRIGGGINIQIDGKPYDLSEHYVWKGAMFENVPNLVFSFGYLDVSWTLGVDVTAQMACKLIGDMQNEGVDAITPRLDDIEKTSSKELQFLPMKSTYVQKSLSALPKLLDSPQWSGRSHYFREIFDLKFGWSGDLRSGLEWLRGY